MAEKQMVNFSQLKDYRLLHEYVHSIISANLNFATEGNNWNVCCLQITTLETLHLY